MAKISSGTATSSSKGQKEKLRSGKMTVSSHPGSMSQSGDLNSFERYYMPSYFGIGGKMKQREQEMDWNTYMNKPMSQQHMIIAKLKMFCEERFDIVILGNSQEKNKTLGNMIFKCFLDPLGKDVEDHIGQSYAEGRAGANLSLNLDNSEDTKRLKDMLAIKEDKIRYTQINILKVYGLGLRIHIAGNIDKNETIATSVAQQQITVMANYLNFKKRYKSGFGMNSFLMILDDGGKLNTVSNCMVELMVSLFTLEVFNSVILLVEIPDEYENSAREKLVNEAKCTISQRACCKSELVHVFPIKSLLKADKKQLPEEIDSHISEETTVGSTLKILNEVARQTYIDPNPFEPEGMDYHDALSIIESVKRKYKLKEKDWCDTINHIYTMIPN